MPSPKSHAYSAIVPSASVDAVASKLQSVTVQLDVNAAVGGTFGAAAVVDRNMARARQSMVVSAVLAVPVTVPLEKPICIRSPVELSPKKSWPPSRNMPRTRVGFIDVSAANRPPSCGSRR